MSLSGSDMGDLMKGAIDAVAIPTSRPALFRAMGNGIVQEIANAGIAAAGVGTPPGAMFQWMTQVGSATGAPPTFAGTAIVKAIAPTYSMVAATLTGKPGTNIPANSAASTGTDVFNLTAPVTLDVNGSASGTFQAESSGAVSAGAHALNTIVKGVDGWNAVDNSSSGTPGVDPVALNGNVLGDLMQANIDALTPVQKQDRQLVFEAIGQAIVSHISAVGIAAAPLMKTWMTQVETVCNGVAPGAVAPLSATFDLIAIVK